LRTRWPLYAGLAATWLVLLALVWPGPRARVAGFSSGVSPWTYLLNQADMITRYLRLAVWPRSLVAFYGWPLPLALGDVLPQTLLVVGLLALAGAALARHPPLGFAGAWFFVILAPTSSVIPISTEVGAERRMYLPLVAFIALALVAASWAWAKANTAFQRRTGRGPARWAGPVALTLVCLALAAATMARNREYGSRVSIARTIVERRPTSIARHILGEQLLAAGNRAEAIDELRRAVPGNSKARHTLAVALLNEGKADEVIEQLRAFLQTVNPPQPPVPRWLEPTRGEVISSHEMMGRAFLLQKDWPAAIDELRRVVSMAPANADARRLLAGTLFGQRAYGEAAMQYGEYLRLRPADLEALGNYGVALIATDQLEDALKAFRRAVDVDPRSAAARRNLATLLFDLRVVDEAHLHAREAVALDPGSAAAHDLLGRTLTLQGKLDEARREFERALEIDPGYSDAREDLQRLSTLSRQLR
jgi:tetratricopeptide (TPR) repeat protein